MPNYGIDQQQLIHLLNIIQHHVDLDHDLVLNQLVQIEMLDHIRMHRIVLIVNHLIRHCYS